MRVRDSNLVKREGTYDQAAIVTVDATIDPNSYGQVIRSLTELYSRTDEAILREYPSNAWDSHQAAGNTDPIRVDLPSLLRPNLVISDNGVGLSYDEIVQNFLTYGLSTKRETDEQVGTLGFGCKSALAFTSQFSLTAVKGGVRTVALVVRGTNDLAQLQVLDTCATDERDGVTIEIPVPKDTIEAFNAKAEKMYRFWTPGSILVDGKQPASIFDEIGETLPLDEDIHIVNGLTSDYVVMGNVAYPCNIASGILKGGSHIVARVGIGDVDFVPSREALKLTKRTNEVLADIKAFVIDRLFIHVQAELDKAADHWAALLLSHYWGNKVTFANKLRYKGEKIPDNINMTGQTWSVPHSYSNPYNRAKDKSYLHLNDTYLRDSTSLLLWGHSAKSMDRETKNALVDLGDVRHVYVIQRMNHNLRKWISGARSMTYQELRPKDPKLPGIKAPRTPVEKWLVRSGSYFDERVDMPDPDAPIVYFLKTDNPMAGDRSYRWSTKITREEYRERLGSFLDSLELKVNLVMVGTTFVERFLKLYPQAQTIAEFFQSCLDEVDAELTDDALKWDTKTHALGQVDTGLILDKKMVKAALRIQACKDPTVRGLIKRRNLLIGSAVQYIEGTRGPQSNRNTNRSNIEQAVADWQTTYPLAPSHHLDQHHLDYINAIFTYRKRRNKP